MNVTKKVLSVILVAVIAFGAGLGGGMAANRLGQTSADGIKSFGESLGLDSSVIEKASKQITSSGSENNITINVTGTDITIAEVVAEKALPSVVSVTTTMEQTTNYFDYFDFFGFGGFGNNLQPKTYESEAYGTGVVVDPAGYILTNSHVINDGDAKNILVALYDGRSANATVCWFDATLDLAVIKIEESGLVAADLGDSDTLRIGSYAAAIGNPLGLSFERSMSQGIVSGLNRKIEVSNGSGSPITMEGLIQTDATINSGNSGGPLLNQKGEVIGINSAKATDGEGMGFAIPINIAKPIVEQIKQKGSFERAYLGISGLGLEEQTGYTKAQLTEQFGTDKGVYVASITAGGGAEKAGLKKADIITKVDGVEVGTMNKLNSILVSKSVGDTIELTILREKQEMTVKVTLTGEIKTVQ